MQRAVYFILAIVLLSGCDTLEYENVSTEAEFRDLIGNQYQSNEDLLAQGIAIEQNHEQVLDYAVLTQPPGISGQEALFKEAVPSGSTIQIIGVERSEQTFFGQYLKYIVTPVNFKIQGNPELKVHHEELSRSFIAVEIQ